MAAPATVNPGETFKVRIAAVAERDPEEQPSTDR